jgi:hypothetical protein
MRQPPRELSADTKRKLSEALRRRWDQRRAERKLGELDELGPCPPGERGHERPGDFYRAPIISQELRAALLAGQNGACPICGATGEELVLDHSHASGRIRGLLCARCNISLAWFRDDPKMLRGAANYLEAADDRGRVNSLNRGRFETVNADAFGDQQAAADSYRQRSS